jgi:hypothetical protein
MEKVLNKPFKVTGRVIDVLNPVRRGKEHEWIVRELIVQYTTIDYKGKETEKFVRVFTICNAAKPYWDKKLGEISFLMQNQPVDVEVTFSIDTSKGLDGDWYRSDNRAISIDIIQLDKPVAKEQEEYVSEEIQDDGLSETDIKPNYDNFLKKDKPPINVDELYNIVDEQVGSNDLPF